MKRLIAFGDSWTHGHGVEEDPHYKEIASPDPFTFHLRMNNSWVRWLADKFDVPFVNLGMCGIDNADILHYINEFQRHLEKDDLIIVMWSFPYRHLARPATKHILLRQIINEAEQILDNHNYRFVNSFYPTFKDEPRTKSFIKTDKWIEIDLAASEVLAEYEAEHDVSVWEYGSRKVYNDQRNFYMGDYHPNLLGYKIIANWICNKIK
jgi:lysophospholipase L1-like esterase